jgi:putative transposase
MNVNPNQGGRARRPVAPTNIRGMVDAVGRRKLPHDAPLSVRTEDQVFFVTICCQPRGLNQLCSREKVAEIFETIAFRNQRGDWFAHLALLMPDHFHGLISFPADAEMKKVVWNWKAFLARTLKINWQRDFFDHRLRQEESYREKADYILANPLRVGLAKESTNWPYLWTPEIVGATGPSRPTD